MIKTFKVANRVFDINTANINNINKLKKVKIPFPKKNYYNRTRNEEKIENSNTFSYPINNFNNDIKNKLNERLQNYLLLTNTVDKSNEINNINNCINISNININKSPNNYTYVTLFKKYETKKVNNQKKGKINNIKTKIYNNQSLTPLKNYIKDSKSMIDYYFDPHFKPVLYKSVISSRSMRDQTIPEITRIPKIINDVKLPFWSKNNSVNFVIELRRHLESNNINNNVNKWIDLIFGSSQRGEKAEENHNLFQAQTYDKIIKIETITDSETRNSLMRQNEMGVTPTQLFENETKSKSKHNSNKTITLDEGKNFIIKFINSNKFTTLKSKYYENNKYSNDPKYKKENLDFSYLKISKIISTENLKLKIFTNEGHFYEIKIEDEDSNDNNFVKIAESSFYKYQNNSNNYACSYRMSDIKTPIVVYNNTQSLIKGGFWDGRLEINNFNSEKINDISLQIQTIFNPDFSPITTIEYSMKEKLFLCGSLHGILYIYKINNYKIEFQKGLYLFEDEITSISINDSLNMFSVSSRDGYINLYILPTIDLVRTIYLNKNNQDNNSKDIFANKIFLSNYPLPCIVSYINSQKIFKSYTINGKLIGEVTETNKITNLKSPIVYTNNNFQDILIYGTDDGFIKILQFPEMFLINSILIFPNKEINEICLSNDKRYCYVWSDDNIIGFVKTSKS